MAKASYGGAGIEVKDVILIGGLGVAAYFLYKTLSKPVDAISSAIGGVGGGISEVSGAIGDIAKSGASVAQGVASAINSGTGAVKGAIEGAGSAVKNIIQSPAKAAQAVKSLLTGKNEPISFTTETGVLSSDLNKSAAAYYANTGATQIQTNLNFDKLAAAQSVTPTKSLTTAKTASVPKGYTLVAESKDIGGGRVAVTTKSGSSVYQTNVGSGTGSGPSVSSKSLNIKSEITRAQSSGQALNLTSLGKGARINLDTGAVSYA